MSQTGTMHNGRELLTIRQAAERAGVSKRTVHRWLREGTVEHVRNPGGLVRIYADSLYRDPNSSTPDAAA